MAARQQSGRLDSINIYTALMSIVSDPLTITVIILGKLIRAEVRGFRTHALPAAGHQPTAGENTF